MSIELCGAFGKIWKMRMDWETLLGSLNSGRVFCSCCGQTQGGKSPPFLWGIFFFRITIDHLTLLSLGNVGG